MRTAPSSGRGSHKEKSSLPEMVDKVGKLARQASESFEDILNKRSEACDPLTWQHIGSVTERARAVLGRIHRHAIKCGGVSNKEVLQDRKRGCTVLSRLVKAHFEKWKSDGRLKWTPSGWDETAKKLCVDDFVEAYSARQIPDCDAGDWTVLDGYLDALMNTRNKGSDKAVKSRSAILRIEVVRFSKSSSFLPPPPAPLP